MLQDGVSLAKAALPASCSWAGVRSAQPSPRHLSHAFIYLSQETKDQHLHTALFLHDSIDFVYCSDYFGLLLSLKSVPFI